MSVQKSVQVATPQSHVPAIASPNSLRYAGRWPDNLNIGETLSIYLLPETTGGVGSLALACGGVEVLKYQVYQPVERRVALLLPGCYFPFVELGVILM